MFPHVLYALHFTIDYTEGNNLNAGNTSKNVFEWGSLILIRTTYTTVKYILKTDKNSLHHCQIFLKIFNFYKDVFVCIIPAPDVSLLFSDLSENVSAYLLLSLKMQQRCLVLIFTPKCMQV